jgi:multiple sugar transport system permease protein
MAQQTAVRQEQRLATRRFRLSRRASEELIAYLFISPWLLGFIVFVGGSMVVSFALSLFSTDLLENTEFVGFRNYAQLPFDPLFRKSLQVTFVYTLLAVPLNTTIAIVIALLLNQKVAFLSFFRTVYYLPALVTGIAVALLWGWVLSPDYGLVNDFLRFIHVPEHLLPRWLLSEFWVIPSLVLMALWGAGTNMLLYLAGLQGIPTQLQEAAKIDGASGWRVFWSVTLPLLTPTIFFNFVMNMIGSFQVFTQNYVLTQGGPNNASLSIVLFLYRKGFQQFHFGYASAVAWVLFAIIMVFTALVFRTSNWVHYEGGLRK